ncbi:EFR1 family ferrodoxin [Serpentinicella alkaliphila]|uniref:Flavodoxin-like protein n=2 Tax=Serpentinicella alkaliphila TaxID=1734049 RepID=A0A4R2T838_9FIRM|nr:EFR1 family ferrodoxin [Serpentinicella alkaliphila]TCP93338.1 flavodoxin-like protein [Serpentinicella alkaliphila]
MKIFYFSGTGNSYQIAKKISNSFDDNVELIRIKDNDNVGIIKDKIVSIVFPIYYFGLPVLVEEFIREINISEDTYLFIIVTKGVSLGGGVKTQLEKLFEGKKKYNYFQYITMGDNFVLDFWDATNKTERLIRNKKATAKLLK